MDAALLQQKIYMGYAKAALRIGNTYGVYRPTSANDPTDGARLVASLPASFNAEDMKYGKPNKYGKPTWYCLIDGTQTQVGDYLIYGSETYFIAAQQLALPILVVECNQIVSVARPAQQTEVGALPYAGNPDGDETPLMMNWPASVLQGTKGEKNVVQLPADTRSPWWAILLPHAAGVTLRSSDILTDELGRRFAISSAELTDLGWRLTCMQALT